MGMQDRDWWRDEQQKRERNRATLDRAVSRVESPSRSGTPAVTGLLKWGHVCVVAFWLAVMGILYLGMNHYLKPKPLIVTMQGDVKIPRSRDGHFYAVGTVNGRPVRFLVDTGASMVTVSEAFATSAGLMGGEPTVFNTANGPLNGRTLRDIPVTVGPVSVSAVRVGVGLVGFQAGDGLLGQSFLSKFRIELSKDELTLRAL